MAAFPKCFYQFCSDEASAADDYDSQFLIHVFSFLHCVFSRHFVRCCDAWQTAEYHTICHRVLSSHCLSRCRLTLLQKLEQVRIHPLMCDDAETALRDEKHLAVPSVGA